MTHNQRIGSWGELAALAYLKGKGHKILGQNVRTPYGEIDLVTEHEGNTVFVEVKTRTTDSFGDPEASVNARKQAHMLACAEYYAQQHEIDHWQIDVIAITGKPGGRQNLRHFENALG
jgi:putative endonuclease